MGKALCGKNLGEAEFGGKTTGVLSKTAMIDGDKTNRPESGGLLLFPFQSRGGQASFD